jgi:hypothetical protein
MSSRCPRERMLIGFELKCRPKKSISCLRGGRDRESRACVDSRPLRRACRPACAPPWRAPPRPVPTHRICCRVTSFPYPGQRAGPANISKPLRLGDWGGKLAVDAVGRLLDRRRGGRVLRGGQISIEIHRNRRSKKWVNHQHFLQSNQWQNLPVALPSGIEPLSPP